MRLLSGEKYDLIFGIGFLFTDSITRVAKDFPNVKFAIVDGFIADQPNVVSLLFKEQEGSFLVGAAAALKSTTGKIGFVGGMKIPLIEKFEAGYIAGAKYVKKNIQVFSEYAGTTGEAFRDPVKGKELAWRSTIAERTSSITRPAAPASASSKPRWYSGGWRLASTRISR